MMTIANLLTPYYDYELWTMPDELYLMTEFLSKLDRNKRHPMHCVYLLS